MSHPSNISTPHESNFFITQVDGGDLNVAVHGVVDVLNPLSTNSKWSQMVLDRIYGRPTFTDPDTNQLKPHIAVGSVATSTSIDYFSGEFETITE